MNTRMKGKTMFNHDPIKILLLFSRAQIALYCYLVINLKMRGPAQKPSSPVKAARLFGGEVAESDDKIHRGGY